MVICILQKIPSNLVQYLQWSQKIQIFKVHVCHKCLPSLHLSLFLCSQAAKRMSSSTVLPKTSPFPTSLPTTSKADSYKNFQDKSIFMQSFVSKSKWWSPLLLFYVLRLPRECRLQQRSRELFISLLPQQLSSRCRLPLHHQPGDARRLVLRGSLLHPGWERLHQHLGAWGVRLWGESGERTVPQKGRKAVTRSIRDSETSIDFIQGPPGSRRERVNM